MDEWQLNRVIRGSLARNTLSMGLLAIALGTSAMALQSGTLTLSGKVIREDGAPPPASTQVELVCNSRVIQVARTRPEGSFHFRLGEARRPTELSASTSGPDSLEIGGRGLGGVAAGGVLRQSGDGRYDLTNCEIRLMSRPDWESDPITLGIQSIFEPDVGVIVLRELEGVKGTTVSVTTLEAPPPAAHAFKRGARELGKAKPNYKRAAKRLEEAVALYSQFAEAWNLLAEARIGLGDSEGAAEALHKSIEADPAFVLPYLTLAALRLEKFAWKEALQYTTKLLELDPHRSQGHYYHGLASYSLGDYEPALKSFLVIERNRDEAKFPAAMLMLGDILARQGRIEESAKRLRRYLEIGKHTPEMGDQLRRQLEQWEQQGLIKKPRN